MKRQVMQECGLEGQDPREYEGDRIASIELGGCPGPDVGCDFHATFWPEPWASPDGARRMPSKTSFIDWFVQAAQHRIATDWKHALDVTGQ
jgi:hypothetical protein